MRHHAAAGEAALPLALALAALIGAGAASAQERGVTVVLPEEPDIIDPCEASRSTVGRVVKQNVTETLTEIDPRDGSITPRLATSWEQVDGDTWRFRLREGVKFHDGEDFDAEAAAHAIKRTLNENMDCEIRIKFFGGVKVTPEVVDAHTLDVTTDPPQPILPTVMGTMTIVSPNTPMDERTRDPIGTGPYRFANWEGGQRIVLERFEDYWGERPEVETATYLWRTESQVRAAMVGTGEADIGMNISPQDATDPEMDFSYPDSETTRLRITLDEPPLDDIRVRRALNLAVDREALRGSILSEDVVPATQLVWSSINGYNPDLKPWPYDPEEAKRLLDEARADGAPLDQPITMIGRLALFAGSDEMMEALWAMYQEVGLNVDLQIVEVAQWVDIATKPHAEDRPPMLIEEMHDNNNGDAVFTV
ncbi:MAG TPA: ABC transporter substrate-binding protein, partial [Geminicoccaceae bacterium]|nr:ABC transporter substrate-binding protein [Geminicoccaceae bacterium]